MFQRPWDEQPFRPLAKAAQPNETFYTRGALAFGDQPVEYGYMLQSHTDGDIYTFFPEENVLVTGGVVCADRWPLIDWWTGGWLLGMVDGLDVLIGVANDTTKVVPGSGRPLTRADLVAQRDMYLVIYERLMKMFFAGRSPAEAVEAEPTRSFAPSGATLSRFLSLAFESIWGEPDAGRLAARVDRSGDDTSRSMNYGFLARWLSRRRPGASLRGATRLRPRPSSNLRCSTATARNATTPPSLPAVCRSSNSITPTSTRTPKSGRRSCASCGAG